MTDTNDVAQLVIRYQTGYTYRYLLAKRTMDGNWEFIGGKRKRGESIEEAARRELDEELESVKSGEAEIVEVEEPYPSDFDSRYSLYPVLMELPKEKAEELEDAHLSEEHSELDWIHLDDFVGYETLGQRKALERLGLLETGEVQGDVVVGVARRGEEYLVLRRSPEESFTGCWEFPGGIVEDGESREETLRREVEEETGLSVLEVENTAEPYIGKGSTGFWRLHPFLVELETGEVQLSEEHDNYKWIELEDIHEMKTYGELKALDSLELLG